MVWIGQIGWQAACYTVHISPQRISPLFAFAYCLSSASDMAEQLDPHAKRRMGAFCVVFVTSLLCFAVKSACVRVHLYIGHVAMHNLAALAVSHCCQLALLLEVLLGSDIAPTSRYSSDPPSAELPIPAAWSTLSALQSAAVQTSHNSASSSRKRYPHTRALQPLRLTLPNHLSIDTVHDLGPSALRSHYLNIITRIRGGRAGNVFLRRDSKANSACLESRVACLD